MQTVVNLTKKKAPRIDWKKIQKKILGEKIKEFGIKEGDNVDQARLKDYAYGIIRNEKVFSALGGI